MDLISKIAALSGERLFIIFDILIYMKYDIAVIGGGPAGMMAAGRAGELGARVVLLEKNNRAGIKLLMTGKGRCNITNKIEEPREMAERYGKNGKFLLSLLHRFGTEDVIGFFESRGVMTKVEKGNRVLTKSDCSKDVLDALLKYLEEGGVEIRFNSEVREIIKKENKIEKIILADGKEIIADKFIISTGGKSYPVTGSTGDGYVWAKNLGHTVTGLSPALTPVIVKDKIVKELEGLSLKDVEISVYKDNKKIDSRFGEALFTGEGMSGPIVINMSKVVARALPGKVELRIDFMPELDLENLDRKVQAEFREGNNKLFKNSLDALLPQKLIPVIIQLSNIDPEKKVNLVTKEERKKLLKSLKEFSLEVKGIMGFEKAMVTSGGVSLNEIDPKTMKSKIVENLFFAGEIIDLDGPTGGYNLQICWSTGHAAGEAAAI